MSFLRLRRKPSPAPLPVQPTGARPKVTHPIYAGLVREGALPSWDDVDAMPLGPIVERGVLA